MFDTFVPYIESFWERHPQPFLYDARELMDGCGYGEWEQTADEFVAETSKFLTEGNGRVVYVTEPNGASFSIRHNYGAAVAFQLWTEEFYADKNHKLEDYKDKVDQDLVMSLLEYVDKRRKDEGKSSL
jgi:hypothetical protein